jgi:hypothetical protein
MFRLTYGPLSRTYPTLLPCLEDRRYFMSYGAPSYALVVTEITEAGEKPFDTEGFMEGLAVLLAPAEDSVI